MVRFLIVVGALLHANVILADTVEGRVVGVNDGDTFTVLDSTKTQYKIRLAGIDAPEAKQAFGQASKKSLSAMVFDRDVTLKCGGKDKYRRPLCVVIGDEGNDVNLAQIEAGMAWWYRMYQKDQTAQQRADYAAAEGVARAAGKGLWADKDPVAPWTFRAKSR